MTLDELEALLGDTPVIHFPQFTHCIVGAGRRFTATFVVYDYDQVIATLMDDGMDEAEAVEWFETNTVGGWYGDGTPCFLTR